MLLPSWALTCHKVENVPSRLTRTHRVPLTMPAKSRASLTSTNNDSENTSKIWRATPTSKRTKRDSWDCHQQRHAQVPQCPRPTNSMPSSSEKTEENDSSLESQ